MPTTPVAFPIAELILQDVVATLAKISTHSGYLNDLIVEEMKQEGNPPIRDGLTIVAASEPDPQPNAPMGFDEYLMAIGICAYVIESQRSDPATLRARLYSVAADIRRALKADLHRGGNAVNTEFDVKDEIQTTPQALVIVSPRIRFRTLFNDPYHRTSIA